MTVSGGEDVIGLKQFNMLGLRARLESSVFSFKDDNRKKRQSRM